MSKIYLLIITVLTVSCSSTKTTFSTDNNPSNLIADELLNEQEESWLSLGIISHDEGDYEQAKEYYNRILDRKPNSAAALYEIAYSSMEDNSLKEGIEYLERGEKIKSDFQHLFYHMHGITLDKLGKPNEAIKAFQRGIEVNPNFHLLHYSLALTSINVGKNDQALASLKQSILSNFEHASSHLLLGNLYNNRGEDIPAILAYTYFLFYEPNSERSEEVFSFIYDLFDSAERDTSSNEINITLSSFMGVNSTENQMSGLGTMMAITNAANKLSIEKSGEEFQEITFLVNSYETMIDLLAESQIDYEKKKFLREYYVPYLVQVKDAGYLETLIYLLFENSGYNGIKEWIINDCTKCEAFFEWEPE